jgi:iodotyrosine deiodinase
MKTAKYIPLKFAELTPEEMEKRSKEFYEEMKLRRTVRHFSEKKVSAKIIENCILAAGTSPSGANMQPWHFVVIGSPDVKKEIRRAAEKEEQSFYGGRAPKEWLDALMQFGTDENKPYLETAPYLIVIFEKKYALEKNGEKIKHYYTAESTGIAAGMLITALHHAGLVTLTHTPSPMKFLNNILNRPSNERPFLILVTGYPAEEAVVPNINKKSIEEISTFI